VTFNLSALLVDAPMVYKAADSKMSHLRTSDGKSSGGLFGFIRSVEAMQARLQANYEDVYVAFELGGSKARAQSMPSYKADRGTGEFWRPEHQEEIRTWCLAKGYTVVTMPGGEADDAIAVKHSQLVAEARSDRVIVVMSKDHDFYKLMGEGYPNVQTLVWMKQDEEPYSAEQFYLDHEFSPARYLDYCSLTGDASDNVPGVLKPSAAKNLIHSTDDWDGVRRRLAPDDAERAEHNRSIVRFFDAPIVTERMALPDMSCLADIYMRWEFNSLLKKMGVT
jgi:DNA polymerase I